jgi:pilus assembly protein CpaE
MSNQQPEGGKQIIKILLVDDSPETRENVKKLLAFEPDFRVVDTASNGREGVEKAKEQHPDIVIMDINMPDMDGLQAANFITKAVPTAGVIMMSVQTDTDYIKKAMLAGARNFLAKPVNMDELYDTVRSVYDQYEPIRRQWEHGEMVALETRQQVKGDGDRAGNVLAIYSPQGGAGTTTLATNLASALMREGIKVLLVDADLQFGDIGVFLNLQAQSTVLDLADAGEDLDTELFENIVMIHDSGLKVLMGPPRPELADPLRAQPGLVASILDKVRSNYDFIVVDTSTAFDDVLISLLDMATRVLLVTTPTLSSIKNVRLVLDLFDQLGYPQEKAVLVVNRDADERQRRHGTISAEKIQNYLKRPVEGRIPVVDDRLMLSAINKGVPVIAAERDINKPPTKQIMALADGLFQNLMQGMEAEDDDHDKSKSSMRIFGR